MRKLGNAWVLCFLCGFALPPAMAGECWDSLIKHCEEDGERFGSHLQKGMEDASQLNGSQAAEAQANSLTFSSDGFAKAARHCKAECEECEKKCKDHPHEITECKEKLTEKANEFSKQSVASGLDGLKSHDVASKTAADTAPRLGRGGPVSTLAGAALQRALQGNSNEESQTPAQSPTASQLQISKQGLPVPASSSDPNSQDCSGPNAYKDDQCASILSIACAAPSQAGSSLCLAFAGQYCGPNGSGLGNSFCQAHNTAQFCNNPSHPEASQCPSCAKSRAGTSSASLSSLPAICQTDPGLLDTGIKAAAAESALRRDGSAGTNAVVSSSRGQSDSNPVVPGADPNAQSAANAMMGRAMGGLAIGLAQGPGGTPEEEAAKAEEKKRKLAKLKSAGRTIASTTLEVSDVMDRFGPNVFLISSQVLQIRCQSGKLMHCGPSK